jgi:hypothetical protein
MSEFPPLIYVDLINVPEPKSRKLIPGRTRWQPWRVVVLSGDNQRRRLGRDLVGVRERQQRLPQDGRNRQFGTPVRGAVR